MVCMLKVFHIEMVQMETMALFLKVPKHSPQRLTRVRPFSTCRSSRPPVSHWRFLFHSYLNVVWRERIVGHVPQEHRHGIQPGVLFLIFLCRPVPFSSSDLGFCECIKPRRRIYADPPDPASNRYLPPKVQIDRRPFMSNHDSQLLFLLRCWDYECEQSLMHLFMFTVISRSPAQRPAQSDWLILSVRVFYTE
jgi:hypothetical protein